MEAWAREEKKQESHTVHSCVPSTTSVSFIKCSKNIWVKWEKKKGESNS